MAKNKTDALRALIYSRIAHWFDYFGLAHVWTMEVVWEEVADSGMSVSWHPGYKDLTFKISPTWLSQHLDRPDKVDEYVVHELLHVLMAPYIDVLDLNFKPGGALRIQFETSHEGICDALARIIRRLAGEDSVCFRSVTPKTPSGSSTKPTPPDPSARPYPRPASRRSPSRATPS